MSHLHVVEPRVDGSATLDLIPEGLSNDFLREICCPQRLVERRRTAIETAEEKGDLIAFLEPTSLILIFRIVSCMISNQQKKYYAWIDGVRSFMTKLALARFHIRR